MNQSSRFSLLVAIAVSAAWTVISVRADGAPAQPQSTPPLAAGTLVKNCSSFVSFPSLISQSSFQLHANLPEDNRWLMITIQKKKASTPPQESVISVAGGSFSQEIYLTDEQGVYTVSLFTSNAVGETDNSYEPFCSLEIANMDSRDLSFLAPSPDVQSDDPEIVALSRSIVASSTTDRDKSIAIHNWMTTHIPYDAADYFNHIAPPGDALSTLHRKTGAVCEGYANLNAALHRAAGIRAQVIDGHARTSSTDVMTCQDTPGANPASNHAWNKILIDGQWLIQDTTWDAGGVSETSKQFVPSPRSTYLFPDPAKFSTDHLQCSISQT